MEINHQAVHDAAAKLFWYQVKQAGVQHVNEQVIRTRGKCLTMLTYANSILDEYQFDKVPADAQKAFLKAVEDEAFSYAQDERNLQGMIYAEDAATGRSPTAMDMPTKHLSQQPLSIEVSPAIQKLGRLCLRSPLPAVVFSDEPPSTPMIWVEDTVTALGFRASLFMSDLDCMQIDDGVFVITGIFSIAVPDYETGTKWHVLVPNSTRFVDAIQGFIGDQKLSVEVQWG